MGYLQAGYGLDENGYIVSDVSIHHISLPYDRCIRDSIEQLSKQFPSLLHGVYVYGSVARGEAVAVKSDLDLLAVFNDKLSMEELAELKKLTSALSQKYCYLVRDVGIAVATFYHVMDPKNYYEQAFLKELCVCAYGVDLRERFGPYKLTPEIAISFNGDFKEALAKTMHRLQSASLKEFKRLSQNVARKLIRTYYSMVMVRSQVWVTRLDEQSDVFIQYFKNKEPIIGILQKWIEEPPTNRDQVYKLIMSEGEWLAENFKREAQITL